MEGPHAYLLLDCSLLREHHFVSLRFVGAGQAGQRCGLSISTIGA